MTICQAEFTAEQLDRARTLRKNGTTWKELGRIFDVHQNTLRRQLDPLFDAHLRQYEALRAKTRRQTKTKAKAKANGSHVTTPERIYRPTAAMLEDAAKRMNAPRRPGVLALGDPPPGYSALDGRVGQQ